MSERAQELSYYAVVPAQVLTSQAISDKSKLVYGVLASMAREDGYCWASNKALAAIMGCGERTISRAIAELTDVGELIVQDVGNGDRVGNHERRIYTRETAVRSLAKIGSPASFGEASLDKNGEAVFNRIDNIKPNTPLEPPHAEKRTPTPAGWKPERFEAFWEYYRRNVNPANRTAARKAWDKLKPDDETITQIGRALAARLREDDEWRRGIGMPHASTYLNGEMWLDGWDKPKRAADDPPAPKRKEAFGVWR